MNVDLQDLAKLAREMAMLIKPRETILAEHELTERDYAKIENIDFYKRAFETACIEWNRPMSTAERIRLISQSYIEATMPTIGGRLTNPTEALSGVIEGVKFLAQVSGINTANAQPAANAAEKFVIQINLGADVERYEKDITPVEAQTPALPKVTDGSAE